MDKKLICWTCKNAPMISGACASENSDVIDVFDIISKVKTLSVEQREYTLTGRIQEIINDRISVNGFFIPRGEFGGRDRQHLAVINHTLAVINKLIRSGLPDFDDLSLPGCGLSNLPLSSQWALIRTVNSNIVVPQMIAGKDHAENQELSTQWVFTGYDKGIVKLSDSFSGKESLESGSFFIKRFAIIAGNAIIMEENGQIVRRSLEEDPFLKEVYRSFGRGIREVVFYETKFERVFYSCSGILKNSETSSMKETFKTMLGRALHD